MSELLNNKFTHLQAEVWDDCITVWHIEVVQRLMLDDFMYYGNDVLDAVKACIKSSTMGELLGNGVRNVNKAKVQVAFSIRGRDIPGTFNTTHDHAYKIAMSRKIAYEVVFRNRVSFNIHYLHEVAEIRSFSGSHPRWSNAQRVKREMKDSCIKYLLQEISMIRPEIVSESAVRYIDPFDNEITTVDILLETVAVKIKFGRTAQRIVDQMKTTELITGLPCIAYNPNLKPRFLKSLKGDITIVREIRHLMKLIKQYR